MNLAWGLFLYLNPYGPTGSRRPNVGKGKIKGKDEEMGK
jgi:hypothetical protein